MFDKECWEMMVACWTEKSEDRPLPGVLYGRLEAMVATAIQKAADEKP